MDGDWGQWEPWQLCSTTCGSGNQTRSRQCNEPLHGGNEVCPETGEPNGVIQCDGEPCPGKDINHFCGKFKFKLFPMSAPKVKAKALRHPFLREVDEEFNKDA